MKHLLIFIILLIQVVTSSAQWKPLFDGKTFTGWEGDTINIWRIQNGEIIGGYLTETVKHNQFIATTKSYKNYILKLKFKLTGTEGFINSGVQFHSVRIDNPPFEMRGYQADLGDGWWGCLYDESRRNKKLVDADTDVVKKYLKPGEWNNYEALLPEWKIKVKLNGGLTAEYTETDPAIPQEGLIAFQPHGGGKTEVRFKDVFIKELP